jgi:hypothetical protein
VVVSCVQAALNFSTIDVLIGETWNLDVGAEGSSLTIIEATRAK